MSVACQQLKNNKVIAVPTDTIYGIAGLAQSNEAVRRIYDIKGRASTKPVAICVGDVQDVERCVDMYADAGQFCERYLRIRRREETQQGWPVAMM